MSHLALYRKYRPESFDQVKGQSEAVNYLESVAKSGRVPHAVILTGSRGIGKTTLARIFARSLDIAPHDIYEIDAASYRKVETMRELVQDEVPVLPSSSPYKMYILDEVHMLTNDSFNTLLKTLEEPPSHVIFVLATTELSKVLPTVVSRCQVIHLKRPTAQILAEQIIEVSSREGKKISQDHALSIAHRASGSFRDALVLLDRVLEQSTGKEITDEDIDRMGLRGSIPLADSFIRALSIVDDNRSDKLIRMTVEAAASDGKGLHELLDRVIYYLRLSLYIKNAPLLWKNVREELSSDQIEVLTKLSEEGIVTPEVLAKFLSAYEASRKSTIPAVPIELAIIDILK